MVFWTNENIKLWNHILYPVTHWGYLNNVRTKPNKLDYWRTQESIDLINRGDEIRIAYVFKFRTTVVGHWNSARMFLVASIK